MGYGVIEDRLDDVELKRLWQGFYESIHPRPADVRRADAMLRRLTKPPRRKRAA